MSIEYEERLLYDCQWFLTCNTFILAGMIWSKHDHSELILNDSESMDFMEHDGTCQLVPFCNLPQHLMFELRPQCKSCEWFEGLMGWFIMEHPVKMDDWYPHFRKPYLGTSFFLILSIYQLCTESPIRGSTS